MSPPPTLFYAANYVLPELRLGAQPVKYVGVIKGGENCPETSKRKSLKERAIDLNLPVHEHNRANWQVRSVLLFKE